MSFSAFANVDGNVFIAPSNSALPYLKLDYGQLAAITWHALRSDLSGLSGDCLRRASEMSNEFGQDAFRIDEVTPVRMSVEERASFAEDVLRHLCDDVASDPVGFLLNGEIRDEDVLPANRTPSSLAAQPMTPEFVGICRSALLESIVESLAVFLESAESDCEVQLHQLGAGGSIG